MKALHQMSDRLEQLQQRIGKLSYILCAVPFFLLFRFTSAYSPLPSAVLAVLIAAALALNFWQPWLSAAVAGMVLFSAFMADNIIFAGVMAILLFLAGGTAEAKSKTACWAVPVYLIVLTSQSIWVAVLGAMLCLALLTKKESFHTTLLPLCLTLPRLAMGHGLPVDSPLRFSMSKDVKDVWEYLTDYATTGKSGALNPVLDALRDNWQMLAVVFVICMVAFLIFTALQDKLKLRLSLIGRILLAFIFALVTYPIALYAGLEVAERSTETLMAALPMCLPALVIACVVTPLISAYQTDGELMSAARDKGSEDGGVERLEAAKSGWKAIAGYEATKKEIEEAILPYRDAAVRRQMERSGVSVIKGLLLFGPPGVGKTMFAKAIASESGMNFISVKGSEFQSKWVGESEKNLRAIFSQAVENAPCVIFFDEIESFLIPREKASHSWERTLVTSFLAEMDGFTQLKNVLIVGATNDPDQIDSAAIRPGRIDKCIYIDVPNQEGRNAIWHLYLDGRSSLTDEEFEKLSAKTERYSAADIRAIAEEAYRRNKLQKLSFDDILPMLELYKPTLTLEMKERYKKLVVKYSRSVAAGDDQSIQQRNKHTWSEIAGMESVREDIRVKIEKPLLYAERYAEMGLDVTKGVLMYGPPGCGKTLFAKVIASEYNCHFITVNGPELLSGTVGESERKLRMVFQEARENRPAIIFFDEFDSIAQRRSTGDGAVKLINQLLTEMDGMEDLKGVLVIAATNRVDVIDPALKRPGRFDTLLYIGMPDEASREAQFRLHLRKLDLPGLDYTQLAKNSEGFTCADVAGCCNKLLHRALDMSLDGGEKLSEAEAQRIVEEYTPTLSAAEIAEYEESRVQERT